MAAAWRHLIFLSWELVEGRAFKQEGPSLLRARAIEKPLLLAKVAREASALLFLEAVEAIGAYGSNRIGDMAAASGIEGHGVNLGPGAEVGRELEVVC